MPPSFIPQLKQIPTDPYESGPDGKRIKKFKRKEYIAALPAFWATS